MTFPSFAEYKAPWDEDEDEFDEAKARKLLYNLDKDKYFINGKAEKAAEDLKESNKALEIFKKAAEEAKHEDESAVEKLARKNKELEDQLKSGAAATERENLLLRVRLEKGLTEGQVKRISGETLEELLADADDYLKDVKPAKADEEEEEEVVVDDGITISRKPKIKTPGDPNPQSAPDTDVAKAIASIPRL